MKLSVLKSFIGKDEGKTLNPGDVVVTSDLTRVNALVGRGYCEIISLEDDPVVDGSANGEETKVADTKTNKGKSKEE